MSCASAREGGREGGFISGSCAVLFWIFFIFFYSRVVILFEVTHNSQNECCFSLAAVSFLLSLCRAIAIDQKLQSARVSDIKNLEILIVSVFSWKHSKIREMVLP